MNEVTRIINAIEQGDRQAADELLPLVYNELRRLATYKLSREQPGQTLQATALVHEAYLRLVGQDNQNWTSRNHFFSAAAEAMRRILVENARSKRRIKRGGDRQRVDLEDANLSIAEPPEDIVAIDEALSKLEKTDKIKSKLIELRFFAGLTLEQAAAILDISPTTAKRYWTYTRAWLYREVSKGQ